MPHQFESPPARSYPLCELPLPIRSYFQALRNSRANDEVRNQVMQPVGFKNNL